MANEPDLVQRLTVDFSVSNDIPIIAEFGTVYIIMSGNAKIYYATTATWNAQPKLVSELGCMYIYSDHMKTEQGQDVPSIKAGDGATLLIDLPFIDDLMYSHIDNNVIHVTQEEREAWNGKVSCYISGESNLVFTIN